MKATSTRGERAGLSVQEGGARLRRSPSMPTGLSDAERVIWRELVPAIAKLRLLDAVDRPLLVDLVRSMARLDAAEADISARGLLVEGERGMVKNPSMLVARQYRAAVLALSQRFGLSPMDRERLKLALANAARAESQSAMRQRQGQTSDGGNDKPTDDPRRLLSIV